MTDEGFLRRWARRKSESARGEAAPPEPRREDVMPVPAGGEGDAADAMAAQPATPLPDAPARALPTLEDVARLTPEADFSSFVAPDVDPAVRRGALKKLFADPHFGAMDGLDVYIDDYTKPSPVSEAMLASLGHARRLFEHAVETSASEEQEAQAQAAPCDRPPVAGDGDDDGAPDTTTTT